VGHVARKGETRNIYRILIGKPDGKGRLGIQASVEGQIKIKLKETGYKDVYWIQVAEDRVQ
jgi:hypothetical protein